MTHPLTDLVIFHTLAGLASTLAFQGILVGGAVFFSGWRKPCEDRTWIWLYLSLLLTVCATAATSAWSGSLIPTVVLITGLAAPALLCGWRTWRKRTRAQTKWVWAFGVPSAVALVYAALPVFRSDQWTYHLSVGKIVFNHGPLSPPILNDHIFFTGIYEFLFALPRLLWNHDTYVQCFADSFTFSTLLIGTFGVADFWRRHIDDETPPAPMTAAFFAMVLPTYDMLTNAKPDGLLALFAFAATAALFWAAKSETRKAWFYLGLISCAPLALKFTWIHFLLAFAIPAMAFIWHHHRTQSDVSAARIVATSLFSGAAVGILLAAPFLLKNLQHFGNPLHPIQLPHVRLLNSTRWSPEMHNYWIGINQPAKSLSDYFETLIKIPVSYFTDLLYMMIPIAVMAFLPGRKLKKTREIMFILSGLALYIMVWPMFFRHDIYPRFTYAASGLLLSLLMMLWNRSHRRSALLPVVLLLPILLNGRLEVKIAELIRAAPLHLNEFYRTFPRPMIERNDYIEINEHRRRLDAAGSTGNSQHDAVVLTDNNSGYFLDGGLIRFTGYDFLWLTRGFDLHRCVLTWAREYRVTYLYVWDLPLHLWPPYFERLIGLSQPLGAGTSDRLRWIPEDLLAAEASREDCPR